ncbi:MAG: RNA polymerase sigma factor [Armatimonadota bacterium]
MQPDTDDALVQQTLAGDLGAFGEIVNRYRTRVYNLAYRMLGDPERAEDAAQDAFIRAHDALDTYKPPGRFPSWLFTIASNRCIDLLRRRPFASASLDAPEWQEAPADDLADEPETAHDRTETQQRVHAALGRLSDRQRLAVALIHLQGFSYEEAAEAMCQPVGTVKSHVHRARARLKTLLTSYVEECAL